jgi:hypothetical protein
MIQALIPQLLPIISGVLEKTVPDSVTKTRVKGEIEKALVDNANAINLETIKTNQIEAGHKSVFVSGWRPAIGWSCAAGIAWLVVGAPIAQYAMNLAGVAGEVPTIPKDLLLELTFAMLGMAGLRSFEKLKGLTK